MSQCNNPNSRSPLAMYTKREKTPQGRNQLIYLIRFFSFKFNMMASLSIMNWMYYNPVCTLYTEIFRRGRSDELALESINTVWRNYQIQFLRGTINYHTVRSNRNKFFFQWCCFQPIDFSFSYIKELRTEWISCWKFRSFQDEFT